jgi:hypothetical protein
MRASSAPTPPVRSRGAKRRPRPITMRLIRLLLRPYSAKNTEHATRPWPVPRSKWLYATDSWASSPRFSLIGSARCISVTGSYKYRCHDRDNILKWSRNQPDPKIFLMGYKLPERHPGLCLCQNTRKRRKVSAPSGLEMPDHHSVEYKVSATDCLRLAATATDPGTRTALLLMAQQAKRAASEARR